MLILGEESLYATGFKKIFIKTFSLFGDKIRFVEILLSIALKIKATVSIACFKETSH